jgi:hypothetical protein
MEHPQFDDLPKDGTLTVIGSIASTFRLDMDFEINGHPYTVVMIDPVDGGVVVFVERQEHPFSLPS